MALIRISRISFTTASRPAQPQWQGHGTRAEVTMMMTVLPVGWIGEWHENPKPQWILPLSGRFRPPAFLAFWSAPNEISPDPISTRLPIHGLDEPAAGFLLRRNRPNRPLH
jgi:hypothetical protein